MAWAGSLRYFLLFTWVLSWTAKQSAQQLTPLLLRADYVPNNSLSRYSCSGSCAE
jgi:hypothetical protein